MVFLVALGRKVDSVLEGKNTLPVVLHADDDPTIFLCLVVERLGKGADPRVRQTLGGTVGILAFRIIVEQGGRVLFSDGECCCERLLGKTA